MLHDEGVIDEQQYTEISARAAAKQAEQAPGWWERLSFWGDFRGRYEGFFYQRDPDGERMDNQQRGRYRLRLGMASQINDYARVVLQFATGGGDNRSANQTFGGNLDWGKDLIQIDLAYLELQPFPHDGQLPLDSSLFVDVGRMPNPFLWKNGRDIMLWDNDINLEGVDFRYTAKPGDAIDVFANTGFFIDDENASSKDPSLYAAQLGGNVRANDRLTVGGRVELLPVPVARRGLRRARGRQQQRAERDHRRRQHPRRAHRQRDRRTRRASSRPRSTCAAPASRPGRSRSSGASRTI